MKCKKKMRKMYNLSKTKLARAKRVSAILTRNNQPRNKHARRYYNHVTHSRRTGSLRRPPLHLITKTFVADTSSAKINRSVNKRSVYLHSHILYTSPLPKRRRRRIITTYTTLVIESNLYIAMNFSISLVRVNRRVIRDSLRPQWRLKASARARGYMPVL